MEGKLAVTEEPPRRIATVGPRFSHDGCLFSALSVVDLEILAEGLRRMPMGLLVAVLLMTAM
jgi:hypothetical protein